MDRNDMSHFEKRVVRAVVVCGLGAAGTLLGVVSCSEPQMYCVTAYGEYALSLELQDTSDEAGDCACLAGEVIYIETYADPLSNGEADWSQGNVVVKSATMGNFLWTAEGQGVTDDEHTPWARGEFAARHPDDSGFCQVKFSSPARLVLDEIEPDDSSTGDTGDDADPSFPGQAAVDMELGWSDMVVYCTPDAQGTQLTATMELKWNGCEATYRAVGLYPAIACDKDADCQSEDNGAANGINPSFAVKCDKAAGMCTLAKPLPSYK